MKASVAVGVALLLLTLLPLAAAKDVTVHAGSEGSRLYFRPAEIKVMQGESIRLTIINDDADTPHDWALLEYEGRDVEVYVRGGQTKTIEFTADTPGEHRVVCQVVGHKQQGMEGTFIVQKKSLLPMPALGGLLFLIGLLALMARRAR